jgi:hypothetical protein
MKHDTGGKWYLNAENYCNEVEKELNLDEYRLITRCAKRSFTRHLLTMRSG